MNIEELAFKDRRELANLNVIDLLDIIELLQKDRKQWIYQFTNTFNESIKINETALSLYKENQELKKQLHEASLTIQEMTEQDIECPSNCEKLRRLEKQLEKCYCNRTDCSSRIKDSKKYDSLVQTQEAQQKEFIKYLEDEIQQQETIIAENQEKSYFLIYEDEKENLKLSSQKAYIRKIILEEILQKYKEIIGDINDKK